MTIYKYKVDREVALQFYKENGMDVHFDIELFNGLLVVEAPDEETSERIRSTFTDLRMWELVEETESACEKCGATGEGATAWGGWCHDCDNQFEDEDEED